MQKFRVFASFHMNFRSRTQAKNVGSDKMYPLPPPLLAPQHYSKILESEYFAYIFVYRQNTCHQFFFNLNVSLTAKPITNEK
jgi:hypothetical protein